MQITNRDAFVLHLAETMIRDWVKNIRVSEMCKWSSLTQIADWPMMRLNRILTRWLGSFSAKVRMFTLYGSTERNLSSVFQAHGNGAGRHKRVSESRASKRGSRWWNVFYRPHVTRCGLGVLCALFSLSLSPLTHLTNEQKINSDEENVNTSTFSIIGTELHDKRNRATIGRKAISAGDKLELLTGGKINHLDKFGFQFAAFFLTGFWVGTCWTRYSGRDRRRILEMPLSHEGFSAYVRREKFQPRQVVVMNWLDELSSCSQNWSRLQTISLTKSNYGKIFWQSNKLFNDRAEAKVFSSDKSFPRLLACRTKNCFQPTCASGSLFD